MKMLNKTLKIGLSEELILEISKLFMARPRTASVALWMLPHIALYVASYKQSFDYALLKEV